MDAELASYFLSPWVLGLLGLLVGSFLNVVIHRLPLMLDRGWKADCAEMLEDGDAAAFAIDELVALLGSDWRRRFTPLVATRWRQEPWIGGSYSHARIGCAGQRAILAAPVDGRIFFAGEACHREDFSTAHGAYETGVAAARAIIGGGAAIA